MERIQFNTQEQHINEEHRYLIQLSIKQNSPLFNIWDYIESRETLEECLRVCEGLWDKSVHKLQIVDMETQTIIKRWQIH